MTHVMNIFDSSLNSNRKLKYFSVEVITFDSESYTEEVEARTAEEAQNICERLQFEARLCRNGLITTQPLFTCSLELV